MAKKVKFNIKNVYYAILSISDAGVATYAAPKHIPGAVNLSLSAEEDESVFHADGENYYVGYSNNGYSGSLEMAEFTDEFKEEVLGYIQQDDGRYIEYADVEPKEFALLYQMDGSPEATRYCMYRVTPGRPGNEAETNTNTKNVKTETINITVSPLPGTHAVKSYVGESGTAFATWFNAVTVPGDRNAANG